MAATPDCLEVVINDPVNQTYAKLVLSDDAATLLGGCAGFITSSKPSGAGATNNCAMAR